MKRRAPTITGKMDHADPADAATTTPSPRADRAPSERWRSHLPALEAMAEQWGLSGTAREQVLQRALYRLGATKRDPEQPDAPDLARAVLKETWFREVYDREVPASLAWLRVSYRILDDPEGVIAAAFARVAGQLDVYAAAKGPLRPWVRKFVRNEANNRAAWKRRRLALAGDAEADPEDTSRGPAGGIERSVLAAQVLGAIQKRLPEEQFVVWYFCDVEGWSGESVAEFVEAPLGTVWGRLRLARAKVLEVIEAMKKDASGMMFPLMVAGLEDGADGAVSEFVEQLRRDLFDVPAETAERIWRRVRAELDRELATLDPPGPADPSGGARSRPRARSLLSHAAALAAGVLVMAGHARPTTPALVRPVAAAVAPAVAAPARPTPTVEAVPETVPETPPETAAPRPPASAPQRVVVRRLQMPGPSAAPATPVDAAVADPEGVLEAQAQHAIDNGLGAAALAALDRLDDEFPAGRGNEFRTAARILALPLAGRAAEARALRAQLAHDRPDSIHLRTPAP